MESITQRDLWCPQPNGRVQDHLTSDLCPVYKYSNMFTCACACAFVCLGSPRKSWILQSFSGFPLPYLCSSKSSMSLDWAVHKPYSKAYLCLNMPCISLVDWLHSAHISSGLIFQLSRLMFLFLKNMLRQVNEISFLLTYELCFVF